MSTFSAKPTDITRGWVLIDAEDLVLGRLASAVAMILRGKHKPIYSTNLDCGDHVVIINAEKIYTTGTKEADKKYYYHTGYPGGIKERVLGKILGGRFPERAIIKAVERMIPRNRMGAAQMKKLHVYAGAEHPHVGQNPVPFDFGSKNRKNTKAAS